MLRGTSLRRSSGGKGTENVGSQQTHAFDMSQHAWLLAPLRELSDNWEVDLAGDLNEYLDTLADLEFTFDGGDTKLNFAEAALLIQGSACVYSKKVEYLHSLVYHALEVITSHKKKKTAAATTTRDAQGALEDEDFFLEDEDHFLNLDDILEEADDINLDELRAKQFTPSRRIVANTSALHLSAGKSGDGKLMMSSSFVHHSGALLLERRDLVHLDAELMPSAVPTADAIHDAGFVDGLDNEDMMMMDDGGAGFDDDDGGEHGTLDNENGISNPTDDLGQVMMGDEGGPNSFIRGDARTSDGTDVPGVADDVGAAADNSEDEEDAFDPYAALDPYDSSGMVAKPYRKASTKQPRRKTGRHAVGGIVLSGGLLPNASVSSGPCFAEFEYAFLEAERAQRRAAQRSGSADARLRHQQGSMYADADVDPVDQELKDAGLGEDGMFYDAPDIGDDDFELPSATLDFDMPAPMEDLDVGDPEVSYEALCRQHIDKIIAAAAAEEVRSELAQRVSIWQGKIEPVLKEADARPAFDIRVYKKDIIESIEATVHADEDTMKTEDGRPIVMFKKVADGVPRHEVCRLFAATLQLVNDGNVKLRDDECGVNGNKLELELQTPVEAFAKIDSYLAPSALLTVPQAVAVKGTDGAPQQRTTNVDISDSPAHKMPRRGRHGGRLSTALVQGKENAQP